MNQPILDKLTRQFERYDTRKYAKGQVITLANEDPKGVSLLISGVVEQYRITPEGNKITVNTFRPSAFFPMSWAINRTPNPYFFGALTDVELKLADADATVAFLQANPDVLFDLLGRVYKGTDAVLQRLVLATSGMAANRLVFELLLEAYRSGVVTGPDTRVVTIKQSVLAARSGLARETVSRELHRLEDAQLIIRNKQGMVVQLSSLRRKLDMEG